MFMPELRASDGSMARKLLAVLPERGLNGEKVVRTEVIYLVIISAIEHKPLGATRRVLAGRELFK